MTNPGESIDYMKCLEGPIVEALAAMEAGRLPHAIKVGEAFLAARFFLFAGAPRRGAPVPETTPLPIAEIPAPKAKRDRPRKSEMRPPIPLSIHTTA